MRTLYRELDMEIDASCVVRLCNFRAPVTVRISSAVLFTRRRREDDPSVRIYPSTEGSWSCNLREITRSFDYAMRPASSSIVGQDSSRSSILTTLSIALFDRSCRLCSIYPLTLNGELLLRLVVGAEEESEKGECNLRAERAGCILKRRALFIDFFLHTDHGERRRWVSHVASIATLLALLSFLRKRLESRSEEIDRKWK